MHRVNFVSFFTKNTGWTGLGTYYDEVKLVSGLNELLYRIDPQVEIRMTMPLKYLKTFVDTKEGDKIFFFRFYQKDPANPESLDLPNLIHLTVDKDKWFFDQIEKDYVLIKLAHELYRREWLRAYLQKLHEHQKVLADKGEAFDQKFFDEIIMKNLKVEIRRSFVGGNGKKPRIKEAVKGWRDRFIPA